MPTKPQTIADAIQIVRGAHYPEGFSSTTAWLGIYQALLWYEPVNVAGFTSLPHIIDADKLRPSAARRRGATVTAWQRRAQAFEQYLADNLGCAPAAVESQVDRLMHLPAYEGLQRQNPLGTAFPGLVRFILETFGNSTVTYDVEVDATHIFPGITMPGRSTRPMIAILVHWDGRPIAIISTKWSVRHDRINDITNECPIYKAAAMRSRVPLAYYVVTNEFDPARLSKMLGDTCINNLIHVHKQGVMTASRLNGRLTAMFDLADFVRVTTAW